MSAARNMPSPTASRVVPPHVVPSRVREDTLGRVLEAIRRYEPVARQDLALRVGLSAGAVSGLVEVLLAKGLVKEQGAVARISAGRPPILLELVGRRHAALGVVLENSRISVAVVNLRGEVMGFWNRALAASREVAKQDSTEAGSNEATGSDTVMEGIRNLLWATGCPRESLLGIGVAVDGPSRSNATQASATGDLPVQVCQLNHAARALGLRIHRESCARASAAGHFFLARQADGRREFLEDRVDSRALYVWCGTRLYTVLARMGIPTEYEPPVELTDVSTQSAFDPDTAARLPGSGVAALSWRSVVADLAAAQFAANDRREGSRNQRATSLGSSAGDHESAKCLVGDSRPAALLAGTLTRLLLPLALGARVSQVVLGGPAATEYPELAQVVASVFPTPIPVRSSHPDSLIVGVALPFLRSVLNHPLSGVSSMADRDP